MKNICALLIVILFVLSGCQSYKNPESTNPKNPKNNLKILPEKNKDVSQDIKNKALILYASDDPALLPYFANSFTNRISAEGVFVANNEQKLNEQWLSNSVFKKAKVDVEKKLAMFASNVKLTWFKGNPQKSKAVALNSMKEASVLLASYPMAVKFSYAELAFWSALATLSTSKALEYALIYEKYATIALKDSLESQLDSESLKQLKGLTSQILLSQKAVSIVNSDKCRVYINGQEVSAVSVLLPAQMPSVLAADCANGSYSELFIPRNQSVLKIKPYFPTSFRNMPGFEYLPKEEIKEAKYAVIILIYWSHSNRYLDSVVLTSSNYAVLKKTRIPLQTKKQLDDAGDNLIYFLKSAALQII